MWVRLRYFWILVGSALTLLHSLFSTTTELDFLCAIVSPWIGDGLTANSLDKYTAEASKDGPPQELTMRVSSPACWCVCVWGGDSGVGRQRAAMQPDPGWPVAPCARAHPHARRMLPPSALDRELRRTKCLIKHSDARALIHRRTARTDAASMGVLTTPSIKQNETNNGSKLAMVSLPVQSIPSFHVLSLTQV
jgi:hypothetical protein